LAPSLKIIRMHTFRKKKKRLGAAFLQSLALIQVQEFAVPFKSIIAFSGRLSNVIQRYFYLSHAQSSVTGERVASIAAMTCRLSPAVIQMRCKLRVIKLSGPVRCTRSCSQARSMEVNSRQLT
jgi:hypothetical protein